MEHLLSTWPAVSRQVEAARHILLLADYDGTLTPIVERPELAALPPGRRRLLRALTESGCCILGIISGRALGDLQQKVGIEGIVYAGNHGLEIEGPGLRLIHPVAQEVRPVLRAIFQLLRHSLHTITGAFVEDKGLTLSVHYRMVEKEKADEVQRTVERVVGGPQKLGMVRVTAGKKVFEVRPEAAWDKGKAVRLLMRRYGKGGRRSGLLPIYIGDDLTDEDAFRVIEKYGEGISVFVGESEQESAARYYLKSPDEVETFLSRLLEITQRNPHDRTD